MKIRAMNPFRVIKKQEKNGLRGDGCAPTNGRDKDVDELQRLKDEVRRFEYDLRELAKL